MASDKDISKIITCFLKNATPEEINELKSLVKEKKISLDNLDFSSMARKTAISIKKQMGVSKDFVKETVKGFACRIIRQHSPDISERDLNILMESIVPSKGKKYKTLLPPEMMKSMVVQFINFSLKRMSEEEIAEMPNRWVQKYLNAFSPIVRGLIGSFLKKEIDEEMFWLAIDEAIRRIKTG